MQNASSLGRRGAITALWLGAFLFAGEVEASGLATARFGGERGTPMQSNATALYYNPGALAAADDGIGAFVDLNVAWRTASYTRTPIAGCEAGADGSTCDFPQEQPEPGDAAGANNGEAKLTNVAAAPMVGVNLRAPIGDDFGIAAAVGFFVPFGGASKWSQNDNFTGSSYPGPVDGVQRWWSIDGTLRSLFFSAAVAASLTRYVHVGVSAGAALTQVDTIRARTTPGNNSLAAEGRTWLDANSLDPHLGAGVLVTPLGTGDLRIALSYQAPVGFNGAKVRGFLRKKIGSGAVQGEDQEVDMDVNWPDVVRLGVSYRFNEDVEARLFGDFTRWSLYDHNCISNAGEECEVLDEDTGGRRRGENVEGTPVPVNNVPRQWNDAFGIRAGMSYWVDPDIELLAGIGYDSSAIPDTTLAPDILDFHDVSVALGARFQFIEELAGMLTYTQFFYIPRDIAPDDGQNAQFAPPSTGPSSHGHYEQNIGVVNVNLELSFDVFGDPVSEPVDEPAEPPAG